MDFDFRIIGTIGETRLRQNLKRTTRKSDKEKKKGSKDKRNWKLNEQPRKDPWNWVLKNLQQMILLMLYYKKSVIYFYDKFFGIQILLCIFVFLGVFSVFKLQFWATLNVADIQSLDDLLYWFSHDVMTKSMFQAECCWT